MPRRLLPPSRLLVITTVALLAAACGGDDPELTSTPEPTATTAEATATEAPRPTPTLDPTTDDGDAAEPSDEPDAGDSDDGAAEPDESGGGEAVPTPTQAPVSGDPAFTAASKLTTVGLDEIFFGDPVDFAAEAAGTEWIGLPASGTGPECYTVQPAGGPAGVVFTVFAGHIERIDITNPIITTRSGAGVGTTEATLTELFGDRLEQTEVDRGNEIMFVPADADDAQFRIIWRTDGLATTSMRAGRVPLVLPASPCG